MNRTFSTEKPSLACNLPLHRLSSVTTLQLYSIFTTFASFLQKLTTKNIYKLLTKNSHIFVHYIYKNMAIKNLLFTTFYTNLFVFMF